MCVYVANTRVFNFVYYIHSTCVAVCMSLSSISVALWEKGERGLCCVHESASWWIPANRLASSSSPASLKSGSIQVPIYARFEFEYAWRFSICNLDACMSFVSGCLRIVSWKACGVFVCVCVCVCWSIRHHRNVTGYDGNAARLL